MQWVSVQTKKAYNSLLEKTLSCAECERATENCMEAEYTADSTRKTLSLKYERPCCLQQVVVAYTVSSF